MACQLVACALMKLLITCYNSPSKHERGKFYSEKVIQKSYPKISHIKIFIQKFYPIDFLSKMYVTYSTSLYNNNYAT